MLTVELLFWLSLILIAYAYLGYPLALGALSLFRKPKTIHTSPNYQPKVSLLISVYNEEAVMEEKLRNSLALDYPKELLEIVVVSDGSFDRTDEIVMRSACEHVVLRHYEGRIGKTACLNRAIPLAEGEILVFSDANSVFPQNVIRSLVAPFADPSIGFVTGGTKYLSDSGHRFGESIGIYSRIEGFVKSLESRLGSCVGADGAIFAIRKSLYRPLNDSDINDLVIPLSIVRAGFRGVFDHKTYCLERSAKEAVREFNRQVRIAARTIRAILNHKDMLNPIHFGLFSFQLISHKVCKLLVPAFLLILFVSNLVLLNSGTLYLLLLLGQVVLYANSWLQFHEPKGNKLAKLMPRALRVFHTFIVVNVAIGIAWIRYLRGDSFTTWVPAR